MHARRQGIVTYGGEGDPSSDGSSTLDHRPTAVPHLSLHAEQAAIRSCLHFNARQSLASLDKYFLPVSASSSVPTFQTRPQPPRGRRREYEAPEDVCKGTALYVGRWNSGASLGMTAKPCWRCIQTMFDFGIRTVLWTVTTPATLPARVIPGLVDPALFHDRSLSADPGPERYFLSPDGECFAEAKVADLWRTVQEASDLETSGFMTLAEEFAIKQQRKRLAWQEGARRGSQEGGIE